MGYHYLTYTVKELKNNNNDKSYTWFCLNLFCLSSPEFVDSVLIMTFPTSMFPSLPNILSSWIRHNELFPY